MSYPTRGCKRTLCRDAGRLDITDVIGRISDIEGMNVTLLRPDLEKVKFLLDNYIEVGVRLEKTGGIKLPL